jgi:hypothetical protein
LQPKIRNSKNMINDLPPCMNPVSILMGCWLKSWQNWTNNQKPKRTLLLHINLLNLLIGSISFQSNTTTTTQ